MNLEANALFTYDSRGRMLMLDQPWDRTVPAPFFFLGRTIDGKTILRFKHDLGDDKIEKLQYLCVDEIRAVSFDDMPKHKDKYIEIFGKDEFSAGPCFLVPPSSENKPLYSKTWAPGNSELVPVLITRQNINDFSLRGFEWLLDEIDVAEPCAGLIVEGRLVSQCRSVRISPTAHEAGLETLPDFRGHGYAAKVTLAWAAAVRDLGALPFYSTSWKNINSQKVARKLGLYYFGNNFSI